MTKTQILILWGLAIVVVVVFAVLSQVIARSPAREGAIVAPSAKAHNLPDVPYTAKKFYPRADQAARTWQGDALLVAATGSWPFARVEDFSEATDWTFQFYSPSTQQLYVVSVSEDQFVPIVSSLSPYELPTVSIENWRTDSHKALSTWLDQGGAQFLNKHSIVDVSARLRASEGGRLEWSVTGVVRESQAFHLVVVDAASGQVVE